MGQNFSKIPGDFYCRTWFEGVTLTRASKLEFEFTISVKMVLYISVKTGDISKENQCIFQFSAERRNILRQCGSLGSKRSMPNASACEWFIHLRSGDFSVKDEHSVTNPKYLNIIMLSEFAEGDRRGVNSNSSSRIGIKFRYGVFPLLRV
uniref:Uncharacterized protein n=1 Tax=Glossina palpalis gambiensis TaxID=67801 RepID=A0A1B0B9C1_9MUSC